MKKFYFLTFFISIVAFANAQFIAASGSLINFGNVTTGDTVWQNLTIQNNAASDVVLSTMLYDSTFILSSTNQTSLTAGAQATWQVGFITDQNIISNSELFIKGIFASNAYNNDLMSIDLHGTGVYPESYYASTQNLSEEALKTALQTLLNNNTISLGYNMARDSMYLKVDNKKVNGQGAAVNTLESVYTGQLAAGFTDRIDLQNNYGFNCEHTFPQSMFNSNEPELSDMFHLYPCDATSNSARGNLGFGIVTTPTWQNGGSMVGNGVFEPRDAQKGRSARSVLYCLMRFGNQGTFVNVTQEQVLKNWNYTFLPDSIEQRRCNDIFSLQHNRNPFIDHPLMAKRITSFISFSLAAMMNTIYFDHTQIEFRDALHDSIYNLVVEANGNQDVHISNIHFSMPSSTFQIVHADTLIHAGEAGVIKIKGWESGESNFFVFTNSSSGTDSVAIVTELSAPIISTDQFQLFPNPANNEIVISSNSSNQFNQVLITDIIGREVSVSNITLGQNHLDVSGLCNGVYKVVLKNENGVKSESQKLIIVH